MHPSVRVPAPAVAAKRSLQLAHARSGQKLGPCRNAPHQAVDLRRPGEQSVSNSACCSLLREGKWRYGSVGAVDVDSADLVTIRRQSNQNTLVAVRLSIAGVFPDTREGHRATHHLRSAGAKGCGSPGAHAGEQVDTSSPSSLSSFLGFGINR